MNEIHKWYENIAKKYADVVKFEIDKDEKDSVGDIIEQLNRGIMFISH